MRISDWSSDVCSSDLKTFRPQVKADPAVIEQAVNMLAEARRPILYTGGGIINSGPGASHLLRELARLTGAPVTSTLMGLGAFPSSDPQWLGMLGIDRKRTRLNSRH